MKDPIGIRITYCQAAEKQALEIIDFINKHLPGINLTKARPGGNPKYKPGGQNYDKAQGEFLLSYSRLNIKGGKPVLPKIKLPK